MGLRESLGDVSADLAKILNQLKDIQKVQKEIDKGATAYSKAVGAVSGGSGGGRAANGTPNGTFSTPPPAPGSQLGGVTSSSAGYSSQRYEEGKTSGMPGWARAAALTGAAAVTYGYNVTPGVEDVYAFQRMKFRASFLGPSGYNQDYYKDSKALFGNMQTDPYGMMTAANIFTMTGQGQGTGNFSRVMRETAVTSAIFGQDNATAAVAQASMNSGSIASRMAKYNIYVSDFQTGNSRGLGALVDQIWSRHYGSSNRAIPYESVAASIRGGWLGVFINKNFGDVPELKEQIIQALLLKAQQNGDRLDYSDLGNYGGGAAKMPMAPGTRSAMGAATGAGLTPENDPGLTNMALQSSRGNVMDATSEDLLEGYRAMAYTAVRINDVITSVTDSGNMFIDFMMNLKGAFQTLSSLGELSPIMGFLSGGLFGGLKALMGFSAGGDISAAVGTSTSDSIPAMLSRGEYVINARAAQAIGVDRLNALNSLGHNFGSGFASPTRHFDKGGPVTSDDVLKLARTKLGAPYVAGADGPEKFDCSGFTEWVYETNFGIPLSEVSYTQVNEHQLVAKAKSSSETVDVRLARPGDLMFFDTDAHENDPSGLGISHVAIYAGNNKIIHAWGPPLAETDLSNYSSPLRAITRLPLADASPVQQTSADGKAPAASGGVGEPASSASAMMYALRANRASVSGFSSFNGGASSLGLGSGSFSWLTAPSAKNLLLSPPGVSSPVSEDDTTSTTNTDTSSSHPDPGNGSGEKWLYDFLASKGLRGDKLKTAWTISMRESGGRPSLVAAGSAGSWTYPDVPGWINWTSSGSPHYDTGLFQINNVHLSKVQSTFGAKAGMNELVDPNKNYQIATQISANWSNLLAWGMNPDGSFNWSSYPDSWVAKYGAATESRTADYFSKYSAINVHGYSEGAYRTHEGIAKLHEGEMVLPATVAEQFRQMMRSASGPGSGGQQTVNINLKIERASDEEAERFAKRVKKLLDEDNWATAVRSA